MDTIKVKVREDIVKRGGRFFDIAGKQKIVSKKAGDVIEVVETPFIRSKIATGELIVISRKQEAIDYTVYVNDRVVKKMPIVKGMSDSDLLELVYSDKVIMKAIDNKDIVAVERNDSTIVIRTK